MLQTIEISFSFKSFSIVYFQLREPFVEFQKCSTKKGEKCNRSCFSDLQLKFNDLFRLNFMKQNFQKRSKITGAADRIDF